MRSNRYAAMVVSAVALAALTQFVLPTALHAEANWPRWRGPEGLGHTAETGLPIKWDASDVVYRVDLKGRGQSAPTIWEHRIFLTSALEDGRQRVVMALDRRNGNVLWEHVAWTGEPEPSHRMNGWASSTCATDGQHVVAFFGRGGLHCFTVDGEHVWSKEIGQFEGPWGTAACPVLYEGTVIINGDSDKDAFIAAYDKTSGDEVWRTKRLDRRGWSSPILIEHESSQQLVLNGDAGVQSYNPKTGEELWFCKSFNGRGSPTVVYHHGLITAINGKSGDVYSIRPDGRGDVTDTHMAWHTPRKGGRDLPSPIVVGDHLFVVNMGGIANCYHAVTGEDYPKLRLEGKFSAAPIAATGKVYVPNEAGLTYVLEPGQEITVVSANDVGAGQGEIFRTAITPSLGQLFIRSDRALYCVGELEPASAE